MHSTGTGLWHRDAGHVRIVLTEHLQQSGLHRHRQQTRMLIGNAGYDILIDRVTPVQDRGHLDDVLGGAGGGVAGELSKWAFR